MNQINETKDLLHEQVQDALEMVQQAPLTDADIQEIEQILKAN